MEIVKDQILTNMKIVLKVIPLSRIILPAKIVLWVVQLKLKMLLLILKITFVKNVKHKLSLIMEKLLKKKFVGKRN